MKSERAFSITQNMGTRPIKPVREADFPDMTELWRRVAPKQESQVDVLLVNPPAPDGGIWIRSQHRVGRRSREGMVWPQVSLAQLAAMLHPDYTIQVVDAIADRMGWNEFEALLKEKRPRYYVTQVTAPTLVNDMYGVMVARSLGARTIAFGTHVTPMPLDTMEAYPALDFVLRGEPELALRELVDVLDGKPAPEWVADLLRETDPDYVATPIVEGGQTDLALIKGLVWRRAGEIVANADRPFLPDLDHLPLPMHELLPMKHYRMPLVHGPYTFIVTSRGCPAQCRFCIKHVSYQQCVRIRSAENIMAELRGLVALGMRNIHMYADLFTVSREQVMTLCDMMIAEKLNLHWTCNSRVDFVDPEMLQRMAQAGCWLISWGIESGSAEILRRVHKGYRPGQAEVALEWAHEAGIKNGGYFIIGLPGETEDTIQETIDLAKRLPLDMAIFHIAAPHPGTPFFMEVVENGWFRAGTSWEEVDMDRSTVLDYPNLTAEQIEYHARRAAREWMMRPGPIWGYIKGITSLSDLASAFKIGWEQLRWGIGRSADTARARK